MTLTAELKEARALARALLEHLDKIEASTRGEAPATVVAEEPRPEHFEAVAARRARRRRG